MNYKQRIIDDQLDLKLESFGATLIVGPKGCGKTKKLVELANASVATAKGDLVYIDKDMSRMHDLDHKIKLVDTSEYDVRCENTFIAFVSGILAGNYDIEKIFFDGIVKIVKKIQNYQILILGAQLLQSVAVAVTGCNFLHICHNYASSSAI